MTLRQQVRFLADDIWDTPDDGNRYEVIDGELYVTPPPGWAHQYSSTTLLGILWSHIREHDLGVIVTAPVGVKLDDGTAVEPDLVYISRERRHIIVPRGVEGAPDLVVEVLSPGTRARDRGIKLRRYAAAGVPHYWMLDPRPRRLEARRLTADGYQVTGIYAAGDIFLPELFPGLEIAIADLWM